MVIVGALLMNCFSSSTIVKMHASNAYFTVRVGAPVAQSVGIFLGDRRVAIQV